METAKLIERPDNPAKRWLTGYPEMMENLKRLKQKRDRYYELAAGGTSRLKPVSVTGSAAVYDRMAEAVVSGVDAGRSFAAEIARINRKAAQIMQAVDQVEDERQRLIITMRYLDGKDWDEIAGQLQRERRWVFVQHRRALLCINRWMEQNGILP